MATTGVVLRSQVQPKNNYLDYRPDLRKDFWYSCAYCSMTELEATGIGFEIDHYLPQQHFPTEKTKYDNLMWCCEYCNSYKSDYYPKPAAQARGCVIIRPDKDDPRNHFKLAGAKLEPTTITGRFTEEYLRLNRQTLMKLREIRTRFSEAEDYIAHGLKTISETRLDAFEQENRPLVANLRNRLGEDYNNLINSLQEFIIAFSKSDLLDEELDRPKKMQERRLFLEDMKAFTPEVLEALTKNPSHRNTKPKKRRKKTKTAQ